MLLRTSFAGGGTCLPALSCLRPRGMVISAALLRLKDSRWHGLSLDSGACFFPAFVVTCLLVGSEAPCNCHPTRHGVSEDIVYEKRPLPAPFTSGF